MAEGPNDTPGFDLAFAVIVFLLVVAGVVYLLDDGGAPPADQAPIEQGAPDAGN